MSLTVRSSMIVLFSQRHHGKAVEAPNHQQLRTRRSLQAQHRYLQASCIIPSLAWPTTPELTVRRLGTLLPATALFDSDAASATRTKTLGQGESEDP